MMKAPDNMINVVSVAPVKYLLAILLVTSTFFQLKAQVKLTTPPATPAATLPITPATDTTPRMVNIEQADRLRYIKGKDSTGELQIAAGNVIFRDGKTKIYCDSAVHNKKLNIIEAFGKVHIIDSDTIHTYSDYLIYHSDTKLANLTKNVKLTDGKSILTTENLDYDTNLKIGTYRNGGKIVSEKTTITSEEAVYYSELKDVYFKRNVKLKDPAYDLIADSLLYNTNTQLATFITQTYIKDTSGKEVVTSSGSYDLKRKTSQLTGRSTVKDRSLTVTADELAMDDASGIFEARGTAVMIDTAQGLTLFANHIHSNRDNNTFLATEHPLMILDQKGDSIYITADTLFSGILKDDTIALTKTVISKNATGKSKNVLLKTALPDSNVISRQESIAATDTLSARVVTGKVTDSSFSVVKDSLKTLQPLIAKADTVARKSVFMPVKDKAALRKDVARADTLKNTTALSSKDSTNRNRFFQGFHHVRIFSDSMQAVSDSLFYSGRDSVFRLYKDPILWANKSQVTGDTIYLYTKNRKPERLKVFENAMMINVTQHELYNQLKGTVIDAYFKDGEIDYVESSGSPAESVYYIQDEDSAFVGMNTATARNINMYFLTKELNKVVFKKEVVGTTYPILQVPDDKKTLRNFKWQDNRRPKTKFELFEDIEEPSPAAKPAADEQLTLTRPLPLK